jgi:uncharacterized protein YbjT (DUF2867 family)
MVLTTVMDKRTAIVLGATGLTGKLLIARLIADDRYSSIKLFSRRASGNNSPKIKEFIGNVLQLESFKDEFTADEVFCCIGTTSAKTRDRTLYKAIDHGIPFTASRLAKENNIPAFLVISSMGANAKSKIFYNRTKGEMERDVLLQEIPNTYVLRPSLILGDREESRFGESVGALVLRLGAILMVGRLKKYRAIKADCIASAMIRLADLKPYNRIVESDRIQELCSKD